MMGRTTSEFSSIRPTTYSLFQKYNARSATYNKKARNKANLSPKFKTSVLNLSCNFGEKSLVYQSCETKQTGGSGFKDSVTYPD